MHISLDSALGRQKRLNSVGESVLQIAPDAAAAYSLRSLTGGDPDVVRVRRESDNTEKNFSGSQIESGEMARWVNEQPTLPLDLRELDTNTGERDGALIEAAAAYSLRKLKEDFTSDVVEVRRNVDGETEGFTAAEVTDGTLENFVNASFDDELPLDQATGAAAAYSLRNLSSNGTDVTTSGDTDGDTTGKYVVQTRRSSDDAVKSFTASEVADGTLTDWVNTDVTIYQSDFSSSTNGWNGASVVTLAGNQDGVSDGTTSKDNVLKLTKNQDSQAYIARDQGVIAGLTYTVSGSFYAPSSNTGVDGILIKDGIAGGSLSDYPSGYLTSNGVWTDFSFSYTATVSGDQRVNMGISSLGYGNPNGSSAGSTGDVVYISDLQFVETTSNGHVRTWYDQSGSDNHAVQTDTAKQPTIVEGGTYLEEVDFDGSQQFQTITLTSSAQPNSVFSVSNTNVAGQTHGIYGTNANQASYYRSSNKHAIYSSGTGAATLEGSAYVVDTDYLRFDLFNGANSVVGVNGTTTSGTTGDAVLNRLDIGDASLGGVNPLNGGIKELILYTDDQSTKRRAIEENIANHYDISLAAFSRDGTVSTWYDQSGNTPANHATQTDPTKQPKIVEGGSLLKLNGKPSIDFSTVDGYLELSQEVDTSNKPCSIIAATEPTNKALIGQTSNRRLIFNSSDARFGLSVSVITEDYPSVSGGAVFTAIHNGTTTAPNVVIYANGSASTTNDSNQGSPMTAGVIDFIGVNLGSAVTSYFDKKLPEVIIYNTDQTDNRTALEANIGETYGITDIPAANDTVNGFVQTWYDQSGNGNDAEQTTASSQPKIVGEVTSGQPHAFLGAIDFDGTNDFFVLTTSLTTQPYNTFSVYSATVNSSFIYSGSSLPAAGRRGTGQYVMSHGVSLAGGTHPSTEILATYLANGASSEIFSNGTSIVSGDAGNTSNTIAYVFGRPANAFGGTAKEMIIYNSDQSSNRPAIEANIANQYGITLS